MRNEHEVLSSDAETGSVKTDQVNHVALRLSHVVGKVFDQIVEKFRSRSKVFVSIGSNV